MVIFIIGVVLFMAHRNYDKAVQIDSAVWGQFGDYVGGVIGAIIAYVSVRLLNTNLQEQIKANIAIKQNNEDNKKVAELQQFDKTYTTLLDVFEKQRKLLDEIELNGVYEKDVSTKKYQDLVDKAIKDFSNLYAHNRNILSAYFRLFYRIMQTIDEAIVDENIKRRYAKIFRSMLSERELELLRYNAMTNYGRKSQPYINCYNILKHLPYTNLKEFSLISQMPPDYKDVFNNIFFDIRKFLIAAFSNNSECEFGKKYYTPKNKTYKASVSGIESNRNYAKIEVEYTTRDNIIKENDIITLLEFFMWETFVYTSFGLYQNADKIKISADHNRESRSQKHVVWATVTQVDGFPLVLSQAQLKEP